MKGFFAGHEASICPDPKAEQAEREVPNLLVDRGLPI
jgi:hypothetical protein